MTMGFAKGSEKRDIDIAREREQTLYGGPALQNEGEKGTSPDDNNLQ